MNFVILSDYILKKHRPGSICCRGGVCKLWLKDRGFYQARSLPNFSL